MAEEEPFSLAFIARSQGLLTKQFEKQFKNHISGLKDWDQISHCEKYLLFEKNVDQRLSIDEVNLSNGELYTVITNKSAKGKKGALVAMTQGTKSSEIVKILKKIPAELRNTVKEMSLDMAGSMGIITTKAFPCASLVIDRFHVQQVVSEAVQEIRVEYRKQVIREENRRMDNCQKRGKRYKAQLFENGDTKRQLLARSRYLLFKTEKKWSESQRIRAQILFREYPDLKKAYELSMMFRSFYQHNYNKEEAKLSLNKWYEKVKEKNIDSFNVAAKTISLHENNILNYFNNRSTNASAESFNAKLKGFRAMVRGARDKKFHLFRISKLYA
jgi:transposase